MLIDGSGNDRLQAGEVAFIDRVARADFPGHEVAHRSNDDGMNWAILSPPASTADLLRFTICRIDHCLVVMVEDTHARRQFRAVASIEDAATFLREISDIPLEGRERVLH